MSWIKRRQEIVEEIKKIIEKTAQSEKLIDEEKFIVDICKKYGCARRTAMEYLKTAKQKRIKYLR